MFIIRGEKRSTHSKLTPRMLSFEWDKISEIELRGKMMQFSHFILGFKLKFEII